MRIPFTARFALLPATLAIALGAAACEGDDDRPEPAGESTVAGQAPPSPTVASSDPNPQSGAEETPQSEPTGPRLMDTSLRLNRVTGLNQPTQIAFLGPSDMLVTEKTGNVVRVTDGAVAGPVLELAANYADERGVLGITLHPEFAQNNYVYIFWTWTGEGLAPNGLMGEASEDIEQVPELGNRVDRFLWDGSKLTFDRNIIELPSKITDLTLDRRRGNHNGGVIKFGPDGKLYVVIGDQNVRGMLTNVAEGPGLQGPADLVASVLRLNDDGTAAEDNPFVGEGEEAAKIFIYGVRNSFGYDFDPENGNFWFQANGQAAYDEIGRYEAGNNVGWIQIMGPPERFEDYKEIELDTERLFDNPSFPPSDLASSAEEALERLVMLPGANYVEPQFSWRYAIAPTDLEFVEGSALGAEYEGNLLAGDVNTGTIYRFELTPDRSSLQLEGDLADRVNDNSEDDPRGELSQEHVFAEGIFVSTDIETSPDGSLWMTSLAEGVLYHVTR